MPIRTSIAVHEYAGRQVKPGDRIEVEQNHIALLLAMSRIAPEKGEPGYQEAAGQAKAPEPAVSDFVSQYQSRKHKNRS